MRQPTCVFRISTHRPPSLPALCSCWASPKGRAREDLLDGRSNVLGQLFQGTHSRKLQDQFRQRLQLKGDLRRAGSWDGLHKWGQVEGKEQARLQALVGYLGSHLRGCLLQCHGLNLQIAECAVHLWSTWISPDQGLSPTLLGTQSFVQSGAQSQTGGRPVLLEGQRPQGQEEQCCRCSHKGSFWRARSWWPGPGTHPQG